MKRYTSLFIAVIMLCVYLTAMVPAYAAETEQGAGYPELMSEEKSEGELSVELSKSNLVSGDEVKVSVKATKEFTAGSSTIIMKYDTSLFTVKAVSSGLIKAEDLGGGKISGNRDTIRNTAYTGELFSVTLIVKQDAKPTTTELTISEHDISDSSGYIIIPEIINAEAVINGGEPVVTKAPTYTGAPTATPETTVEPAPTTSVTPEATVEPTPAASATPIATATPKPEAQIINENEDKISLTLSGNTGTATAKAEVKEGAVLSDTDNILLQTYTDDSKLFSVDIWNGDSDSFSRMLTVPEGLYISKVNVSITETDIFAVPLARVIGEGEAKVGKTLTASIIPIDVPEEGARVKYEWQRDDEADGDYTAIENAENSPSYTVTDADIGKYIRVCVTGEKVYTGTVISAPWGPVKKDLEEVTISGTMMIGETLEASVTPEGATVDYKWQRQEGEEFVDIPDATESTYTLTQADVGKKLKVIAEGKEYYDGTVEAVTENTVKGEIESITITGEGEQLLVGTALQAVVSPSEAAANNQVEYQWFSSDQRNGRYDEIPNANKAEYITTIDDLGKYIQVMVIGIGDYESYAEAVTKTCVMDEVTGVTIESDGDKDTFEVGDILTAVVKPDNAKVTYEWQISDALDKEENYSAIPGATEQTYTVRPDDIGKFIRVKVMGDETQFYRGEKTSAATSAVKIKVTGVQITGEAWEGKTVTAVTTPANADVSYKWLREEDEEFKPIEGADKSEYKLSGDDIGKHIKVEISSKGNNYLLETPIVSEEFGPVKEPKIVIGGDSLVSSEVKVSSAEPDDAKLTEYQWQRSISEDDYEDISDATTDTYTLTANDAGKKVRLKVTFTDPAAGVKYSNAIENICYPIESVSIEKKDGQLNAVVKPEGAEVTYKWMRSDSADGTFVDIENATESSYMPTNEDINNIIKVVITGINDYNGTEEAVIDQPVAGIVASAEIEGYFMNIGDTLEASITPQDAKVKYVWQLSKEPEEESEYADITGEIGNTYTITNSVVGKRIRLKVVGDTEQNYYGVALSKPTDVIRITITDIKILGGLNVGSTLNAVLSPKGANVLYEWLISDSKDGTFTNIPDANQSTYEIQEKDADKFIKVKIRPQDDNYKIANGADYLESSVQGPIEAAAAEDPTGLITLASDGADSQEMSYTLKVNVVKHEDDDDVSAGYYSKVKLTDINNLRDVPDNIMFALYDEDNRLVKLNVCSMGLTDESGFAEWVTYISVPESDLEGSYVKAFVWDGENKLTPQALSVSKEFSAEAENV